LFILPAHGHVLGAATAAIARLKGHRSCVRRKCCRAVAAKPGHDLNQLVALVYDDTPVQAHGIARRSLLAIWRNCWTKGR
jgi:hypothetical protein